MHNGRHNRRRHTDSGKISGTNGGQQRTRRVRAGASASGFAWPAGPACFFAVLHTAHGHNDISVKAGMNRPR